MRISTHAGKLNDPTVEFDIKPRSVLFYIVVGLIAIAVSVPAAIATSDIGIFEECFDTPDICLSHR